MRQAISTYFITYVGRTGLILMCSSIWGATIYNYPKISCFIVIVLKKIIYLLPIFYDKLSKWLLSLYTVCTTDINRLLVYMLYLGVIFFVAASLVLFFTEDLT